MTPDKHYFEKVYLQKEKFTFKYEPGILKDILKQKKSGKVLDLGCGQGGLSLELAKRGFDVTCVDISKIAIEKIKDEATKRKIKANAICEDLENYKIQSNYDIIIACGILQFLGNKGESFVKQMANKTNKEGINVIDAFVNKWLPKGKLEDIYSSWKFIEKENYVWGKENKSKMIYLIVGK